MRDQLITIWQFQSKIPDEVDSCRVGWPACLNPCGPDMRPNSRGGLDRPVPHRNLAQLRNEQLHRWREISVPEANHTRFASKLELVVLNRDNALCVLLREDLRRRQS